MTAVATGCFGQPRLVKRRDFDHVDQLHPLDQQLGNTVATMHDDRGDRVEVNQCNLDLAAIAGINCAGSVDDRKTKARSQTGARMHQADHAVRDRDRDAGRDQRALTRREFDMLGAVEIDAGVTVVGSAGQRKARVQADNRKTGRHGGTDYS